MCDCVVDGCNMLQLLCIVWSECCAVYAEERLWSVENLVLKDTMDEIFYIHEYDVHRFIGALSFAMVLSSVDCYYVCFRGNIPFRCVWR